MKTKLTYRDHLFEYITAIICVKRNMTPFLARQGHWPKDQSFIDFNRNHFSTYNIYIEYFKKKLC